MIKDFYNITKFTGKIIFFVLLFVGHVTLNSSYAEFNPKYWSVICGDSENKKGCVLGATSEYENKETKKKKVLGSAFIELGSTSEKSMKLINKEENTYKLDEVNKAIPVFFVYLPLNTDLRKRPLTAIDGNTVVNLSYIACNNKIGCKAIAVLNMDAVEQFKKGKVLSIIFPVIGRKNNLRLDFSLKGFAKGYARLNS